MDERKIAILYICIGRYSAMWEGFYESASKYLFLGDKKHFYVFTDSEKILNSNLSNVTVIREQDYGWPGNTLYRFRMFAGISEELKNYDYAYFFNANACFVKPLSDEILPKYDCNIIAAQHFKMKGLVPIKYGYDRNKKSKACVKWGEEGTDYVQACFIGATAEEMIKMSNALSRNIEIDEKNGVVAKWHDESHFNNYIIGKKYSLLPVSYVYPEVLHLPINIDILMRSKEHFADLNVLRYGKKSLIRVIKEKTEYQWRKVEVEYHYMLKKMGILKNEN